MRWIWVLLILAVPASFADEKKKVVVIGFDGADHRVVEEMLAAGQLPNLSRLKEMGGFAALTPTNPPQTPVSWSTFATGLNPGRTGIFDFIKRKEGTYAADFALRGETRKTVLFGERNGVVLSLITFVVLLLVFLLVLRRAGTPVRVVVALVLAITPAAGVYFVATKWLPESIPAVFTVRQGKPMWKILEEKGRTASIIRLPVTFPAEPLDGQMIAGLAVPDIRGTIGKPSIYTNDPAWKPEDNQFSIEIVKLTGNGPWETKLLGPPNKLFYDAAAASAARREGVPYTIPRDFDHPLDIEVVGDQLKLTLAGKDYMLKARDWSPWFELSYKVNPLITLKGFARFYLERIENSVFKLYMSPVNLHPDNPLPLSYPPKLAGEVWAEEPYKTMGWALDTWSIGNSLMDEDHFLADVDLTVTRFESMMERFLKDNDRDLFVQVFSFTDRIGHILWRYWDEGHPLYNPEEGEKYREVIRDAYRRMDKIVGRAMELTDLEKTVFLVCSDHGFSSFRYQFNFNTWLVRNGYMKLKKNVLGIPMKLDDLQTSNTPFTFVDWEHTKAYALGLGMIFINLEGREPEGSVKPEEYDALCRKLAEELKAFVDEETGQHPVREVHLRDDMYRDYDPAVTPDLRVATALNWRVSWDTTLGGMPEALAEINPRNWSGDHCSLDPRDVKGILFSSIPIQTEDPHMADLCPSILSLMGVDHGIDMDGKVILGQ